MSSHDIQTLANRNTTEIDTAHFAEEDVQELLELDPSRVPKHPTAWCISLTFVDAGVQMVFNISSEVILGRLSSSHERVNFIDLSGYNAHEMGVSREHALLILKGTKVMLRDNKSTNRTLLNNKKLRPLQDYPLKPGDLITLGRLQLKYNLLFNPFGA